MSEQATNSYLVLQAEADLQQLIDDHVVESEVLDFKGALYPKKSGPWTPGHEFAKDVAALANNRGGLLILGMKELNGVASGLSPINDQSSETAEQRLHSWLVNYSAPPVRIVIQEIAAEEAAGFYLLVRVPISSNERHAVSMPDERSLCYPVRHGKDTRYMSEHEVARRYNDRFQGQAMRRVAFDQLILDGANNLDRRSSVWLWLAMRPDEPLSRRLDTETAKATRDWFAQGHLSGPLGSRLETSQAIAGPGCMTFTSYPVRDGEEGGIPWRSYVELHADGSSFVALDLKLGTKPEHQDGEVGYFTLIDGIIPLVDVACRWAVDRTGVDGTAAVAAGLIDTNDAPVPIHLVSEEFNQNRRVRGTRSLRTKTQLVITRDDTAADLAACVNLQGCLSIAHACMSLLLQRFGQAEPEQFTSEGQIRWREWKHYAEVKKWADQNGIETVEEMAPTN